MDVLVHLAERAGDVVSHDELLTRYWRGPLSSANAVHKCIAELRRAFLLHDPRIDYIETVPKRGYRVAVPVVWSDRLTGSARDPRPAIAVLPFVNMSSDPEQDFFSDGIAEDILNRLAQVPQLVVKARTSSFSFKGQNRDVRMIGGLLGVSHLLEGSVRKAGNRIRITTQLIETNEDKHVWSAQYDRPADDVFTVQDEISLAVLEALNLHLLNIGRRVQAKVNVRAYHLYLLGRHHNNHMDHTSAITVLDHALAIEPGYADASAALAEIHFTNTGVAQVPVKSKLPLVRELIDRALAVDPHHVVARQQRATVRFMTDRDYQAALDECADIARTHANVQLDGYSILLRAIGRSELALVLADRALELDPLSALAHRNRAMFLRDLGRFDEAAESIEQARLLGLKVLNELVTLAMDRGDASALAIHLREFRSIVGADHWMYQAHAAALAYMTGEPSCAKDLLAQAERCDEYRPSFFKWTLALNANDLEKAVAFYADALTQHEHLAFTWSQGNVGMRRLYPWYYESAQREEMLRAFGLDRASVARLKVDAAARS